MQARSPPEGRMGWEAALRLQQPCRELRLGWSFRVPATWGEGLRP